MDEAAYTRMPETRVGGWALITTLIDAHAVSKSELAALYAGRWHVELDLRDQDGHANGYPAMQDTGDGGKKISPFNFAVPTQL